MTELRLSRVFWIGAAAILIAAALVAVTSILSGNFSDTSWKIFGTLFSLLLAGAVAISGYALVERQTLAPLGWAAVGSGVIGFMVVGAAIWDEFDGDALAEWAGISIALLIALLLVTTQLLLLRVERLAPLFFATAIAAALAVIATTWAVLGESDSGADAAGSWEAVAIFWVFTALGYLLLPVLQRFTAAGAPRTDVRVLGTLDGVELVASRSPVEGVAAAHPASGESLFLRRRG